MQRYRDERLTDRHAADSDVFHRLLDADRTILQSACHFCLIIHNEESGRYASKQHNKAFLAFSSDVLSAHRCLLILASALRSHEHIIFHHL